MTVTTSSSPACPSPSDQSQAFTTQPLPYLCIPVSLCPSESAQRPEQRPERAAPLLMVPSLDNINVHPTLTCPKHWEHWWQGLIFLLYLVLFCLLKKYTLGSVLQCSREWLQDEENDNYNEDKKITKHWLCVRYDSKQFTPFNYHYHTPAYKWRNWGTSSS